MSDLGSDCPSDHKRRRQKSLPWRRIMASLPSCLLATFAIGDVSRACERLVVADGCPSTPLASLSSSTGDGGQARCRKRAARWRRWAVWLPAMVSFAGEAGQLLWRRWAGGWRFATGHRSARSPSTPSATRSSPRRWRQIGSPWLRDRGDNYLDTRRTGIGGGFDRNPESPSLACVHRSACITTGVIGGDQPADRSRNACTPVRASKGTNNRDSAVSG